MVGRPGIEISNSVDIPGPEKSHFRTNIKLGTLVSQNKEYIMSYLFLFIYFCWVGKGGGHYGSRVHMVGKLYDIYYIS